MSNISEGIIRGRLEKSLTLTNCKDLYEETVQIVALLEDCATYLDGWVELIKVRMKCSSSLSDVEEILGTALEHHPNSFDLWMQLGEARKKWNSLGQAIECYQQASRIQSNCIEPQLKIVELLLDLRRSDEAEILLNELLKYYPSDYTVITKLGRLERKKGNRERALELFELAVKETSSSTRKMNASLLATQELSALNRLDEALEIIEPILEEWPQNTWAKMILGNLLMHKKDFWGASKAFQEVLQLSPEDINAYAKLAQALKGSGKSDDAIHLLNQTSSHVYNNHQIQQNLGILYRDQHDREKAIECFQRAFDAVPTDLWYSLSLANEWIESNSFELAEEQLTKTLEYHPGNIHVLLKLGKLAQKCQKLETAISYYQQAEKLHHNSIEPSLKIVQTLISFNEIERAESKLLQLLQQHSDNFSVIKQFGLIERWKENSESAIDWFLKAKELTTDPEHLKNVQLLIAEEQQFLGQVGDARQNIEALLKQYPDDIDVQMSLGGVLQRQLDFGAASKIYEKAIANNPGYAQARIELAKVLSQSKQTDQAIDLLIDAHRQLGPNLQILMRLGQLVTALDDWDTARGWYDEAHKLYPFSPQPYTALASIMTLQGDSAEGLALLQRAQSRMPCAVEIPLKIAHIYRQLGNIVQAIQELMLSQERFPHHIPLRLLLARLHMDMGAFNRAQEVIDTIDSKRATWQKEIERIRGDLALNHYDYQQAEAHFRRTLVYLPTPDERNRLATILAILGKLDEASTQLKLATESLAIQSSPGKSAIPLISHSAKIIRSFRTNPFLLGQLLEAQDETGEDRILALSQIVVQEPAYLGAASALTKELRHQGIFAQLLNALPGNQANLPSIPRRIIQYWNDSVLPKDVQHLCHSWPEVNPDYEYRCFSRQEAIAFIKQHYDEDKRILAAFQNCDEPATQSDFFRLAYLNKMGGFYADADDGCRSSLDTVLDLNPELVLIQEPLAHIGNNFIGCIPGQTTVRVAFYRAVENLLNYSGETPWFKTGPGLMTCALSNTLLPYLFDANYRLWPRLWVMSQAEVRAIITQHVSLPYKQTERSWSYKAYQRKRTHTPRRDS